MTRDDRRAAPGSRGLEARLRLRAHAEVLSLKRKKLEDALIATENDILAPLDADERASLLDMLERVLAARTK